MHVLTSSGSPSTCSVGLMYLHGFLPNRNMAGSLNRCNGSSKVLLNGLRRDQNIFLEFEWLRGPSSHKHNTQPHLNWTVKAQSTLEGHNQDVQ